MEIKPGLQPYYLKKIKNFNQTNHINRYENHIFSNISNYTKKLDINENSKNYAEKTKKIYNSFFIPEQILKSLLTTMNKNTKLSLNSLNTINFIYQTYNKGINIIQPGKTNRHKSMNVENCLNQRKFITNYNPNFSVYSTIIGEGGNSTKILDNFKNVSNEEILNVNDSYNKENCSNFISPNNIFFKKNVSMKNIDSNYNHLINKAKIKNKNKYKAINKKDFKYKFIHQRSNSCSIQNNDIKNHENKKIRYELLSNKYNLSNNFINFALLPIKDILEKFQKIEKIPPSINNRNIKSSFHRKNKIINEKDNPQAIKIFTEKYEKEKENFNNILFDECIELRKKKFKLESFIKRFTNKHFVEKLYKAKEYSLKKYI
jgi:hypothetical protein